MLILRQRFFSKYVKADLIAKDKGAIEVYHRQRLELQKGDTIRWTRNNKLDKDIVNSERATISKINKSSTGQRINGSVGRSKGKVYVYENNPGVLIDYTGVNKRIWDYLKDGQLASSSPKEIMDYLLQHAGPWWG